MGNWISKDGIQVPATEEVALTDPKTGKPYIYKGPDRSATAYLKEQGVDHLGRHFSEDPELIARVRQIHNMSMKEYMDMMGYDAKTTQGEFEKRVAEPVMHTDPPRKSGAKFRSGGANTAGNSGHLEGDFGEPELKGPKSGK